MILKQHFYIFLILLLIFLIFFFDYFFEIKLQSISDDSIGKFKNQCQMELGGFPIKYSCHNVEKSFVKWGKNGWEKEHLDILKNSKKKCLITFGEWIGPIAMFWLSVHQDRPVLAFEPDPIAFTRLFNNMNFYPSKSVTIKNMCVNKNGSQVNIQVAGESDSRIEKEGGRQFKVNCISYNELYFAYAKNDCFWKIDTEGAEEHFIEQIIENPPNALSFSIHPQFMNNSVKFAPKLENLKKKFKKIISDVNWLYLEK